MRENKIRAWDQFNAEYIYSDDYEKMSDFWLSVEMRIDGGNHVIIEYCTGLKHKNGKESYEGDIVKRDFKVFLGGKLIDSEIRHVPVTIPEIYLDLKGAIEIIGNIHEKDEIPY